jgi:hypothetical protein
MVIDANIKHQKPIESTNKGFSYKKILKTIFLSTIPFYATMIIYWLSGYDFVRSNELGAATGIGLVLSLFCFVVIADK